MPKIPIISIFREKSNIIIIVDFLFITSLTLKLIISRINVRENQIGNKESTIQRHRQHWEQDTVRRETKTKTKTKTKNTRQKLKR
jgi:hypothetical protein